MPYTVYHIPYTTYHVRILILRWPLGVLIQPALDLPSSKGFPPGPAGPPGPPMPTPGRKEDDAPERRRLPGPEKYVKYSGPFGGLVQGFGGAC